MSRNWIMTYVLHQRYLSNLQASHSIKFSCKQAPLEHILRIHEDILGYMGIDNLHLLIFYVYVPS